jgi:peptide/nickel transport system ATP-binding protein
MPAIHAMGSAPILSVRRLTVRSGPGTTARTIVDGLSLDVGAERVALVGESGSGKSLCARAILGLLRRPLTVRAEHIALEGRELRQLPERELRQVRGREIALVLQDARHALNPALTVGRQLDEALSIHRRLARAERRERALEALCSVGLPEPDRLLGVYPHALSGGMGQRVMIAMMLINEPRLLIADEPTSALDAALRRQVLELISRLVDERRMGLLLISHDLAQVARYCERALVIHRGRIVDEQPAGALATSTHPYTRALWSCRPAPGTHGTVLPIVPREAVGEGVP